MISACERRLTFLYLQGHSTTFSSPLQRFAIGLRALRGSQVLEESKGCEAMRQGRERLGIAAEGTVAMRLRHLLTGTTNWER